jgi:hypothetical protein
LQIAYGDLSVGLVRLEQDCSGTRQVFAIPIGARRSVNGDLVAATIDGLAPQPNPRRLELPMQEQDHSERICGRKIDPTLAAVGTHFGFRRRLAVCHLIVGLVAIHHFDFVGDAVFAERMIADIHRRADF